MSWNRRAFLRGAGTTALGLPFLAALQPKLLRGQPLTRPKRLILVMNGQGMHNSRWIPSGGTGALSTLPEVLSPLTPHIGDLTLVSGIDNRVREQLDVGGAGHNPASRSLFTAWPYAETMHSDGRVMSISEQHSRGLNDRDVVGAPWGPSLDQVIASRIGTSTRLPSLHLRVGRERTGENELFFSGEPGSVSAVGGENRPHRVLEQLISYIGDSTTPPPEPTRDDRLAARRGSILDAVLADFGDLHSNLGPEDRGRLEQHASFIRDLERRLGGGGSPGGPTAACSPHTWSMPGGYEPTHEWIHITSPAMIDNAVLSLACDITRVVTLQYTDYVNVTMPFIDGLDVPGDWSNWHEMVHGNQDRDETERGRVYRWYAEQMEYLISRLKAIDEGDGTLLDNTLIVWMSEVSNARAHDVKSLPVIMAGGAGGRLRTGQHFAYTNRSTGDLFTTVLRLFDQDDEHFGLRVGGEGESLVSGPLTELLRS